MVENLIRETTTIRKIASREREQPTRGARCVRIELGAHLIALSRHSLPQALKRKGYLSPWMVYADILLRLRNGLLLLKKGGKGTKKKRPKERNPGQQYALLMGVLKSQNLFLVGIDQCKGEGIYLHRTLREVVLHLGLGDRKPKAESDYGEGNGRKKYE